MPLAKSQNGEFHAQKRHPYRVPLLCVVRRPIVHCRLPTLDANDQIRFTWYEFNAGSDGAPIFGACGAEWAVWLRS